MLEVDACVEAFLRTMQTKSKVGSNQEGVYYWNEREVQWELFRHLRERAVSRRIGSEWWFHAEGTVERPAWARWGARRRADIVMMNHSQFKRWIAGANRQEPRYEALIELKLVWSGQGKANTIDGINEDLSKMANSLRGGLTKEAYVILIDSLGRDRMPYYSEEVITTMLANLHVRPSLAFRLHLWHWPDSNEPVRNTRHCPWRHYTAYF